MTEVSIPIEKRMIESFEVQLERIRQLSESTRDFRFRRSGGLNVPFKPGQFYRFSFEDAEGEFERSYSLCNLAETLADDGILDLVVSTVDGGRASKLLFQAEPSLSKGLKAQVKGPFGRLILPLQLPKRLILVATSVGIAPYMPILWQLNKLFKEQVFEVCFLYGTRDKSEFIYGDELLAFAKGHNNFDLSVCYSRELMPKRLDHEYEGYVTARLAALEPDAENDHVLLCGNPQMVDDCFALLKSLDFNQRQVVREKYVFATAKSKNTKVALSAEQKRLIAEKMSKYSAR